MEGLSSKQEGHEVARGLSLKKGGDVNLLTGGSVFQEGQLAVCQAFGVLTRPGYSFLTMLAITSAIKNKEL